MRSSVSLVPFVVAAVASGALALELAASKHEERPAPRSLTVNFLQNRTCCYCAVPHPPFASTLVQVNSNLELIVNDGHYDDGVENERIALADLPGFLRRQPAGSSLAGDRHVVFVDAAASVSWGHVVKVMDTIRSVDNIDDRLAIAVKIKDGLEPPIP